MSKLAAEYVSKKVAELLNSGSLCSIEELKQRVIDTWHEEFKQLDNDLATLSHHRAFYGNEINRKMCLHGGLSSEKKKLNDRMKSQKCDFKIYLKMCNSISSFLLSEQQLQSVNQEGGAPDRNLSEIYPQWMKMLRAKGHSKNSYIAEFILFQLIQDFQVDLDSPQITSKEALLNTFKNVLSHPNGEVTYTNTETLALLSKAFENKKSHFERMFQQDHPVGLQWISDTNLKLAQLDDEIAHLNTQFDQWNVHYPEVSKAYHEHKSYRPYFSTPEFSTLIATLVNASVKKAPRGLSETHCSAAHHNLHFFSAAESSGFQVLDVNQFRPN